MTEEIKAVHTIVLDSGPLIKNDPSISSLIKTAHKISTIPQVISEIRDENTRSRLDTLLKPLLDIRQPRAESVKFITAFARRTGDLTVLSRTDLLLLALTYEIECERNDGDWRLRRTPAQKGRNGNPPKKTKASGHASVEGTKIADQPAESSVTADVETEASVAIDATQEGKPAALETEEPTAEDEAQKNVEDAAARLDMTNIDDDPPAPTQPQQDEEELSESESEGWITPSNLSKHQSNDSFAAPLKPNPSSRKIEAAILTSDYAMQRVALQVGLDLLSASLSRISKINTFVLRCHACFLTVKDMSKQFCPRCGQAALTRVACSTNAKGEFKLHFKANYQYNKRGDRFSIPKPVGGSASGKVNVGGGGKGGGKGGWGTNLILAEDQKEYVRAVEGQKRAKERDLLDEDCLPGILSGERKSSGGRPKVGAGRNVNSRKGR